MPWWNISHPTRQLVVTAERGKRCFPCILEATDACYSPYLYQVGRTNFKRWMLDQRS